MDIRMRDLTVPERHRIMSGVVVPRPIAFVTTVDLEGKVNAAPFSWFSVAGMEPPLVSIAVQNHIGRPGQPKDTARNIQQTGEFVVNLVTEEIAPQMNLAAAVFPPDIDELAVTGLTTLPSIDVRPPRIAGSPVHLECRQVTTVEIQQSRLVIGEVLRVHVPDGVIDPKTYYIQTQELNIIGRMHPPGWAYLRTTDRFNMPAITYEEWLKRTSK